MSQQNVGDFIPLRTRLWLKAGQHCLESKGCPESRKMRAMRSTADCCMGARIITQHLPQPSPPTCLAVDHDCGCLAADSGVTQPLKPGRVPCGVPNDAPWGFPLPSPTLAYSMTQGRGDHWPRCCDWLVIRAVMLLIKARKNLESWVSTLQS